MIIEIPIQIILTFINATIIYWLVLFQKNFKKIYYICWYYFSGLLINVDNIPVYFTWIQYLSPIRYILQETYKNEFKGLKYNEQDLEPNIDYMSFNKLSLTLDLCLLSGITLILLILGCVMLFISIKRSMSRTKYI